MQKLNDIQDDEMRHRGTLTEKLEEIQKQHAAAAVLHSNSNLLIFGVQEQILHLLTVLEEKVDAIVSNNAKASEGGDVLESRSRIESQADIFQIDQQDDNIEEAILVDPVCIPAAQPAELDADGSLKALWGSLLPLLILSMILTWI